ncbi:MAG TPA: prepilin-type N-terminal cleavage/methylation domain-containing protein [Candidatus Cloacimonadota bacterium]|nr:prepilin-type N-terminal cleavage/methylation domain-containing protein [Candidatus Cloacimonadota bacterium]HPT70689.1 prepilin-type N-terminal cleavage/methylation domain-containing protein [Candidatus Cloacimonadota bacterium]
MIRNAKSQFGFTLIELVVAIAISGVIFAAAATAFAAFFSKYEELTRVSDLQTQAYDCLQRGIKYGLIMSEGTNQKVWYGVANADTVSFFQGGPNGAAGIVLKTQAQDITHQGDYVKFWFDGKAVRGTYLHGTLQPSSPIYLFPKQSRNNKIKVTGLSFSQVNSSSPAKVLQVNLSAKVEIRKNVYRYVSYSTKMAINKM